jgi:lysophospholipase
VTEAAPEFDVLTLPDGGWLRWAWWRPAATPSGALAGTPDGAPVGTLVGTAVVLGGRCEYLEKYRELAGDWLARGWQVVSLDWRGQGRSSRFLAARERGHIPSFELLGDDLRTWLDVVVAPRAVGPIVLYAHSMGGLVALDVLSRQPGNRESGNRESGRFAAAVLTAPMVAFDTAPWPRPVAKLLSAVATGLGWGERYAFGQGDYDPAQDGGFEGNPVSGDPVRFRRIHDGYRDQPELKVGGVTFGWLAAAFRVQARLLRPVVLGRITLPVLVLTAADDRLVPTASQHRLVRALPAASLRQYPKAGHDLMAETDPIRTQVWADIDNFLGRVLAR